MHAAWYTETGLASQVIRVGNLDQPRPNRDEVLVRVYASGVNPSDTKKRMGWRDRTLEYPLIVPHHDGAGIIEDVDGNVSRSRIGERVWMYNAQYGRPYGTAAEIRMHRRKRRSLFLKRFCLPKALVWVCRHPRRILLCLRRELCVAKHS